MSGKSHISSRIRSASLFIAAAAVLQFLCVMLFTPQGLSVLYPAVLRFSSEKVAFDGAFTEYYDIRDEFSDSDVFIVGADTGVSATYEAILDYIRFLKQTADISVIAIDTSTYKEDAINLCIASENEAQFQENMKKLRDIGRDTKEFYNFVRELYNINSALTPQRKLRLVSDNVPTLERSTVKRMDDRILSDWPKDSTVSKVFGMKDPEELIVYMRSNEAIFREYLGDEKYEEFMEIGRHAEAGDYVQWQLSGKLDELYSGEKMLVICPAAFLDASDPLGGYLSEKAYSVRSVQIRYSSCESLSSDGTSAPVDDISLPFTSENEVRFVSGKSVSGFLGYYEKVANPFAKEDRASLGAALENFSTENFFVICNSGASSYAEVEK